MSEATLSPILGNTKKDESVIRTPIPTLKRDGLFELDRGIPFSGSFVEVHDQAKVLRFVSKGRYHNLFGPSYIEYARPYVEKLNINELGIYFDIDGKQIQEKEFCEQYLFLHLAEWDKASFLAKAVLLLDSCKKSVILSNDDNPDSQNSHYHHQ